MDHNGFYADLDSLNSLTSSIGTNSFNDTLNCSTLPSLNNFKYQQSTNNIYQQQPDLNQTQNITKSTSISSLSSSSTSALPPQININNCNNNIFFPHDDSGGLFDTCVGIGSSNSSTSTSSISLNNNSSKCFAPPPSSHHIHHPAHHLHSHHRKDSSIPNVVNGGNIHGNSGMNLLNTSGNSSSNISGGDSNITYNINNINTNIVNNINNPTNLVNSTDIFGSNQFHQINKSGGETIINFTNNNLNATATGSMPMDITAATSSSQNFYNNYPQQQQQQQVNGIAANSSSIYETQASNSSSVDMGGVAKNSQTSATSATIYHHTSYPGNTLINELGTGVVDYTESLSAAKVINSFESKNPIKYSSSRGATGVASGGSGYYKNDYAYAPPTHSNNFGIYPPPPTNGMKTNHYEIHRMGPPSVQRNHYPNNPPYFMEEPLQNRSYYPPRSSPYHHPHHAPHPPPPHQYGNYYNNNYNVIPSYPSYPPHPHQIQPFPNASSQNCSKSTTPNYSKTGAMAISPVEHSSFPLPPVPSAAAAASPNYNAKGFSENPYYYDTSSSCAKKTKSDIYNNVQSFSVDPLHHHPSLHQPHPPHHIQQNGNVMRNGSFQQQQQQQAMPKSHYNTNGYAMPSDGLNSCDYYRYKNDAKMIAKAPVPTKQFKTFNHFEPPHHPYSNAPPQYHTMQVKHPGDKIKISIDLEEQINSSKIPKMREPTAYGYDIHYPSYYPYHHHHSHHHRPMRNVNDNVDKLPPNINISLRDFLSTWNEIDEDETQQQQQQQQPMNGIVLEELNEHIERTIMREYNPMFVQKASDNMISAVEVSGVDKIPNLPPPNTTMDTNSNEKLYVLETIDVPISELNKYKHLSIINKLPENVVITGDKELFTDCEKLYKSEFELEFEACEERKINKVDESIPTVEVKSSESEAEEVASSKKKIEIKNVEKIEVSLSSPEVEKGKKKKKLEKLKKPEKLPKMKILKLKKEKISTHTRNTKRLRKYSLNQRTSAVRSLQSICVDFLNTSHYRNYAREQMSINRKFSKMKVLKDFKKKFNFDGMKKQTSPLINQKLNHSVMRGRSVTKTVPTLRELATALLSSMNVRVVDLFTPPSLKELCESFIYSNRQFFHIEEVSAVPKLQDLCKDTLSAANIYINIDNDTNNIYTLNDSVGSPPIYNMIDNNDVGELFESDALNAQEKSELLRKIHSSIDDDDEIIRAIGALHDDDDDNNNNLYDKSIIEEDYEELFQSVQYEEIISINRNGGGSSRGENLKMKKIVEILRHKYLNRPNVRQACRTIHRIMHKSLTYQRAKRFHNARRKERINELLQQARNAMCKLRKKSFVGELIEENSKEVMVVKNITPPPTPPSPNFSPSTPHSNSIIEEIIKEKKEVKNFPKMPIVFPSINEYKIEQQQQQRVNHRQNNNNNNNNHIDARKRKMSFDESLLNINKMYRKRNENSNEIDQQCHRVSSINKCSNERRRRRSRSRHRSDRESTSRKNSHNINNNNNSSRKHDHYRNNASHSEARRLIIPSYKIYDKNLDVKLKVRPYVRIEREERLDDLVKKYN